MSVLGTILTSVTAVFSLRPGITERGIAPSPSRFRELLTITVLHPLVRLDKQTNLLLLS